MRPYRVEMVRLAIVGFLVCASVAFAQTPPANTAQKQSETGFVTVEDGRFVDQAGRHVILQGMNVGQKYTPYLSWHTKRDYQRMREWGFNCVRQLIIWAAIEPECGVYNDQYLKGIDERIAWAKEAGLNVMLDMHQDLWGEGVPGADGAPQWAMLDDGRPHAALGFTWSDAYLVSKKVQACFDNFWANKPGPDGVGIQERFALAWRHVAKRYANEPAVVGFDILNEPFAGSKIVSALGAMIPHLRQFILTEPVTGDAILERFKNVSAYSAMLEAAEPVLQEFERGKLAPMFQRVTDRIRQVNKRHVIFIEPSVDCNLGIRSDLPPVLGEDGAPDPLQAYAPHAYDIVTDTPDPEKASTARLELIFQNHLDHARKLGLPMLIGEWGAFYGSEKVIPVAHAHARLFEKALASDTYWDFHKGIEKTAFFEALERPYPQAVAGTIQEYRFDPQTRVFECVWDEDPQIMAPSLFFVPAHWYPKDCAVELSVSGPEHSFAPISEEPPNRVLSVPPSGQKGPRTLTLKPQI